MLNETTFETSHGQIAVYDSPGERFPVLMIHANSLCKEAFHFQIEALTGVHRIIAVDLPGHDFSSDAINPLHTYNFNGYADALREVIAALDVDRFAILGHSLGGHGALEVMRQVPDRTAGTMIFGTPPIPPGPEGAALGFLPNPEFAYTGKQTLTEQEVGMVVELALGSDAVADESWKTETTSRIQFAVEKLTRLHQMKRAGAIITDFIPPASRFQRWCASKPSALAPTKTSHFFADDRPEQVLPASLTCAKASSSWPPFA
ncbi:alpha/beta hydrolase [Agrobacterium fabrum]|uniref:alpha/beta hydrolase n=1 Tax=Agrobacterium fabrum TaxID=1176649 RepID=UPI001FCED3A5|nr:alpha/beta hydrolase [Agrobacterium fabrum]